MFVLVVVIVFDDGEVVVGIYCEGGEVELVGGYVGVGGIYVLVFDVCVV